jgi:hypothetical protein
MATPLCFQVENELVKANGDQSAAAAVLSLMQ